MPDGVIRRPVIVLGAPRSGTSILKRCLAVHPATWHLAAESHSVLEGPFHPARNGYESNRVQADQVPEDTRIEILKAFFRRAINLNELVQYPGAVMSGGGLLGRISDRLATKGIGILSRLKKPSKIRFLEKTPKNSLRVPMLEVLFPDALYVWNRRNPRENIDSLIAGWRHEERTLPFLGPRFARAGYPVADQLRLKDYAGRWWKFALVPGWRSLGGKSVADVAALQYLQCNRYLFEDLKRLPQERIFSVRHEDFVRMPLETLEGLLGWADLPWDPAVETFAEALPRVNATKSGCSGQREGLRFPDEVAWACEALPDLGALSALLGYALHRG